MSEGLSEKFARLQQEGRKPVQISLEIFRDIFFPEPPPKVLVSEKLKVFGAGLPRSGTGSLAVALSQLGYQPCHGPGAFELAPVFAEHYAGRASNSDLIRAQEERGFDAQGLDQLGWKLFQEAATVPDVKIILTVHPRGAEAWAESWSSFVPDHIYYFSQRPFRFMDTMVQMMTLQRDFLTYIGNTHDPRDPIFEFPGPSLSESYQRHNEAVKQAVPADRLLVFTPTDGWDPLCRFLEIQDCPSTEFPHMTDRGMMMIMSKVAMILTWIWPLIPLGMLAMVVSFARYCRLFQRSKTKVS